MVVKTIPIPEKLKNRPVYKGMAVPYIFIDQGGDVIDFKGTDGIKVAECLWLKLCSLCGTKLDKEIAFLGGPISSVTLYYTFPPMHEECAEYAAKACPHLAKSKPYATDAKGLADFDPAHSTEPLDEAHMIIATNWHSKPKVAQGAMRAVGFIRRRVFKDGQEQGQML